MTSVGTRKELDKVKEEMQNLKVAEQQRLQKERPIEKRILIRDLMVICPQVEQARS
jgi:hypothetical protein